MHSIESYVKNLHIHFEDKLIVAKRTIVSAIAIVVTAAAVFGIDTVVSNVMQKI